ncbi:Ubiquinone biosynthesis monooxygenase UbiB [Streptococcus constellatus]|nr:Ubiquinone biosynthesis monooxygenase UbiB [Streptococcus constellatus]
MLSFIKQVFKDGFFHGDPHPGNLLIYEGKIYFIDFGITGELETGFRVSLNDMLSSFTTQDIDSMTQAILTITTTSEPINKLQLEQDIERMLTKYGNLELGSLSITDMFEDVVAICRRHHLQVPSQMAILEKAALQIEGLFSRASS